MTIELIAVSTFVGDPYTVVALSTGPELSATMWRCLVGDAPQWDSIAQAVRDNPDDESLAKHHLIRLAGEVVGIDPGQAAQVARLCAAQNCEALGLSTLDIECANWDQAGILASVLDGAKLSSIEIISLLSSIADDDIRLI